MTNLDRISFLEESHRLLDKHIDENANRLSQEELQELKKKRLAIRDEISRLQKIKWEEEHERVDFDRDR